MPSKIIYLTRKNIVKGMGSTLHATKSILKTIYRRYYYDWNRPKLWTTWNVSIVI